MMTVEELFYELDNNRGMVLLIDLPYYDEAELDAFGILHEVKLGNVLVYITLPDGTRITTYQKKMMQHVWIKEDNTFMTTEDEPIEVIEETEEPSEE